MKRIILVLILSLIVTLALPLAPTPVQAASQTWYLTDYTSMGVSGADYHAYKGSGNGGTDALTILESSSKVWVASLSGTEEASNIVYRASGTWSVTLWADGEGNSASSLTVDIGVLSSGTFTSKGVSAEQTVAKAGGTLNFTVITTGHNVNPGEYLAVRINCTSSNKHFDLDVLGATNSPCYVSSPATADTYPGAVIISFTVTDYNSDGVNFGNLNVGDLDKPADQTASQGAITLTVGSETNVNIDIQLKGDNFSGPATLTLANADVQYDDDDTLDEGTETGKVQDTLTTSYATWYSVSAYTADVVECYHWISIPAGQAPGDYTSTFYYQAAQQ